MEQRQLKPEVETVVELTFEESAELANMVAQPAEDPTGQSYLDWIRAQAQPTSQAQPA